MSYGAISACGLKANMVVVFSTNNYIGTVLHSLLPSQSSSSTHTSSLINVVTDRKNRHSHCSATADDYGGVQLRCRVPVSILPIQILVVHHSILILVGRALTEARDQTIHSGYRSTSSKSGACSPDARDTKQTANLPPSTREKQFGVLSQILPYGGRF